MQGKAGVRHSGELSSLIAMQERNRILIVGREEEYLGDVIKHLEGVGCVVTSTLNDGVAIDLAVNSDFDALLIGDDVPLADGRYIAKEARSHLPSIPIITVNGLESVLTQLRQAGISI